MFRFNVRLLLLTVLILAVAAGGFVGYRWWANRPEHLFASAQKYAERAQQAEARGDGATAKSELQYADKQLQSLLDANKAPNHVAGLMLRQDVLKRLSVLAAKEESERGETGPNRPSEELIRQSWRSAEVAAALDPRHAHAQATMMMAHLFQGQIAAAEPYAKNLVKLGPGDNCDGDWPSYGHDQSSARFVLAWTAMHTGAVPRSQEALDHLRVAAEMDKREAPNQAQRGVAANGPRWRVIALEALALAVQAEPTKQIRPARPRVRTPEEQAAFERLRDQMPGWLERVKAESALPAGGALPSQPTVASMAVQWSPSDTPALLDLLMLGIAEAVEGPQLLERVDLALSVCEKLTAPKPPLEPVLREVLSRIGRLPDVVKKRAAALVVIDKQPSLDLPKSKVWSGLCDRIDHLGEVCLEGRTNPDADAYLGLALNASRQGRPEAILRFATKGLEALERLQRTFASNSDPAVKQRWLKTELALHERAAWVLLIQHKQGEAEKHLAVIRQKGDNKELKQFVAQGHLMEGLLATYDGRLEQATQELELAKRYPSYEKSIFPCLGLAYAYMGLGKYERALPELEKVREFFQRYDQLTDEQRAVADRLLPNPVALDLEFFRCHLGMGRLRDALTFKDRLRDLPEAITASVLLTSYYLGRAQKAQGVKRTEALEAARKELSAARKVAPSDPRVVWTEARLLMTQADGKQGLEEAENLIKTYASSRETLPAMLTWVRWLQFRGRLDEAGAVLENLQKKFPERRRSLEIYQAQLLLTRGQSADLQKLLKELESEKKDFQTEMLGVMAAGLEGNGPEAGRKLDAAFSRYDNNGLAHLWQGRLAQARGDYRLAIQSYERGLQFVQFRGASETGMLSSLLGLAAKEGPRAANELTSQLLQVHPREPALLLAFADTAVLLDNITGAGGMEGTLKTLEAVLNEKQPGAMGAYLLARGWAAAGRPDLARREVGRALQADAKHEASLLLAAQLALQAEDWQPCIDYAETLERLHPTLPEPPVWRAAALAGQGQTAAAEKVYQAILDKHPDGYAAYAGLAGLAERSKDYERGLQWLKRWHERSPGQITGLGDRVRLLTLAGRADQAGELAERFLTEQLKQPEKPAGDQGTKASTQPTLSKEDVAAGRELAVAYAAAAGFKGAKSWERAEAWGQRALAAAEKRSERFRPNDRLAAQVLLAEIYFQRSQQESVPDQRKHHVDQAIALYQEIYQKMPGHVIAGNNLAWLLDKERGNADAALEVIQGIRKGYYSQTPVSGDRLSLQLLDTLGVIYLDAKKYEDALALFTAASSRYTDEPLVFLYLARAHAGLDQRRAALENFNKAVRLAEAKVENARDPQRKGVWRELLTQAIQGQQKASNQ